ELLLGDGGRIELAEHVPRARALAELRLGTPQDSFGQPPGERLAQQPLLDAAAVRELPLCGQAQPELDDVEVEERRAWLQTRRARHPVDPLQPSDVPASDGLQQLLLQLLLILDLA